jgi:hypothetical protein
MVSVQGRIWAFVGALLAMCLTGTAWASASRQEQHYGVACAVVAVDRQERERSSDAAVRNCAPPPSHEGFRPIEWVFYPEEPLPEPASTSIVVAVHENRCTGGRDPIPHLQRPEVGYLKKAVVITLWIEVLKGPQTCPGNPVGRLKVKLPGPLGGRQLYDGSTDPPRKVEPGEDPRHLR